MSNPYATAYNALPADTALVYPDIRLFIEGVQVPFSSISVIEQLEQFPVLEAEIMPSSQFIRLGRAYQPKVHLFVDNELCFDGFIARTSLGKNSASSTASTTFTAFHKFAHVNELTMNFTNNTNVSNYMDAVTNVTLGMASPDGLAAAALRGISPGGTPVTAATASSGSISSVATYQQGFISNRWSGFPAAIISLWNAMKLSVYSATAASTKIDYYETFRNIYVPLLEQGVMFFDTLSGHSYLENQNTGLYNCHGQKVKIPTVYIGLINSVTQAGLFLSKLKLMFTNNHEAATLWSMIRQTMSFGDYIVQPLAKAALPGALSGTDSYSVNLPVETVLHPSLPFYYPPACNVLYANQIFSYDLNFDNYSAPTQLVGWIPTPTQSNSAGAMGIADYIRSPQALRKGMSVADGGAPLGDLFQKSFGAASLFEYGQGTRVSIFEVPEWLYFLYFDLAPSTASSTAASSTATVKPSATQMEFSSNAFFTAMEAVWELIYPNDGTGGNAATDGLNPFSSAAWGGTKDSASWKSLGTLTMLTDYEFSKRVLETRTASVSCLYNPNIVVSYPMMVVDPAPDGVPFMGMVTSCAHTITPEHISTNVTLANVYTLEELGRFYIPPLQPYMLYALGFTGSTAASGTQIIPTIVNNPPAFKAACAFYSSVFGVGAVAPEHLYNFKTQQVLDAGQQSIIDCLAQSYRPGISMKQVEALHGSNYTFITKEMIEAQGAASVSVNIYQNPTNILYEFSESEHLVYGLTSAGPGSYCSGIVIPGAPPPVPSG